MRWRAKIIAWILPLYMAAAAVPCRGQEGVYSFTDEAGAISLSNVPSDSRYQILLQDSAPAVARPLPPPAGVAPTGTTVPARLPGAKKYYDKMVSQAALRCGLESALLHAVISVESQYNAYALSKKGAMGLMQLMPETAKRYGVSNAYDPQQNLNGGANYLCDLLKLFNGDVRLALAAYNAGESTVAKYGNRIPPLRETREYVPKVIGFYRKYRTSM